MKRKYIFVDPKKLVMQAHAALHDPAVKSYEEKVKNGSKIANMEVQKQYGEMILVHGHHRREAYVRQKKNRVKVTQFPTVLFARGENTNVAF